MLRYLFICLVLLFNVVAASAQEMEEVIVTADPLSAVDNHLSRPVQVLTEAELSSRNIGNIGETLANEPGVSSSDFGPGSGRPVIRGLGGARVKILENGIDTLDLSTISADHAVATEPALARQIEIFRGPATLLYGSGASGGLVNLVNDRILRSVPAGLEGELLLNYDTVTDGLTGAGRMNTGTQNFAFHVDAMVRDTDDYDIPGFAELEPDELAQGTLENSSLKTDNIGIGMSYVGNRSFIGLALSRLSSDYGVPGGHGHHGEEEDHHDEEDEDEDHHHNDDEGADHHGDEEEGGVRIDMKQTRYDLEAALDEPLPGLQRIKTRWAYNDYKHDEVEGNGEVGTRFNNNELEGRVDFLHAPIGHWNGVVGIQYRNKDFSATGEEAFVPPTTLESIAVFALEKVDYGRWHLELGARYEKQNAITDAGVEAKHRAWSFSGGASWDYMKDYQLGVFAIRSQRAPTIEELFAYGPHLATSTFEVGEPNLNRETSINIDLYWRKTAGRLTFSANFFYNQTDDFTFLQEQDLNNDGVADRVEEDFSGDVVDILEADEDEEPLLVYQTQSDADFLGFELETLVRVLDDSRSALNARLWTDYVKAERDNNTRLPRITPWRFGAELNYARRTWYARLDYTRTNRQSSTAPLETSTSGYHMLGAYLAHTVKLDGTDLILFVRGTNLLNEEARRHTSFVKDLAPLPGRSASFGIRAVF